MMDNLSENPVLGHITTFGGHPVSCAAGMAAFKVLINEGIVARVNKKSKLFTKHLNTGGIKALRASGLLLAVEFENENIAKRVINHCIEKGVLTDWFLFAPHCMRIAPPLNITRKKIMEACRIISEAIALHTR
jgi:acetylornithine/N-succinyldiaminopimelate aminotransferase